MKLDKACLKLDTVDPDYINLVDRPQCRYDVNVLIDRMKACGGKCVIQSMFLKGAWQGVDVDQHDRQVRAPLGGCGGRD